MDFVLVMLCGLILVGISGLALIAVFHVLHRAEAARLEAWKMIRDEQVRREGAVAHLEQELAVRERLFRDTVEQFLRRREGTAERDIERADKMVAQHSDALQSTLRGTFSEMVGAKARMVRPEPVAPVAARGDSVNQTLTPGGALEQAMMSGAIQPQLFGGLNGSRSPDPGTVSFERGHPGVQL